LLLESQSTSSVSSGRTSLRASHDLYVSQMSQSFLPLTPCGPLELWNRPDPYSCPDGIKKPLNQSLVSFGLVYAYVSSFSCTVVIDCFVFLVELMFSFATVVRLAGKMGL